MNFNVYLDADSWPAEVLQFRGDPAVTPFESSREALRPPSDDPLR